jgi:transcriptional regulator with XRE-family HTH domain
MSVKRPDPVDIEVGHRIRIERLARGLSQTALANQLGVTFQQVQKYEKGTNRIGSSRMLQISEILKRPVSWFFDEQPKGKESPAGTDVLTQMLATPYGVKLAESYLAIKHNADRHVVAEVAHALAGH